MKLLSLALLGLASSAYAGCEIDCKPVEACKELQLDIIFAVDDSGSMSRTMWTQQSTFVREFAKGINEKFGGTRLGLVQWGTSGRGTIDVWKIDRTTITPGYDTVFASFINAVNGMVKSGGMTPTENAFNRCRTEFARTERNDQNGNKVKQICVVVTDGGATYASAAASAASQLKQCTSGGCPDDAPFIMMVGVAGATSHQSDMDQWASDPDDLYSFSANNFDIVIGVTLPEILNSMCFYVDKFEQTCVSYGDSATAAASEKVLQVKGSGFNAKTGKELKCMFRKGPRKVYSDFTKTKVTEGSCAIPPFDDTITNDVISPNYFVDAVYVVEVIRDYDSADGSYSDVTINNNPIYVQNDCSKLPTADPAGFNPFATAAPGADGAAGGGGNSGASTPDGPDIMEDAAGGQGDATEDGGNGNGESVYSDGVESGSSSVAPSLASIFAVMLAATLRR